MRFTAQEPVGGRRALWHWPHVLEGPRGEGGSPAAGSGPGTREGWVTFSRETPARGWTLGPRQETSLAVSHLPSTRRLGPPCLQKLLDFSAPAPPPLYLGAWPQPLLLMAEQVYMRPLGGLHVGPQVLREHPPAGRGHAQGVTAAFPSQLAPSTGQRGRLRQGRWPGAQAQALKGLGGWGAGPALPLSLRQCPGCWRWMLFLLLFTDFFREKGEGWREKHR